MRRAVSGAVLALLGWLACAPAAGAAEKAPSFADLPGWAGDDHAAALAAFLRTCRGGRALCAAARAARDAGGAAPRLFFESWFEPAQEQQGFLTGYFEPEVPGSLTPDAAHPTPLLTRPASLAGLPDREAIEAGALGAAARPLVYLDPVDAFMVHVQGSARIRLGDGRVLRVGFDGKNGHPYTAIGKVLAEREGLPPSEVTADRLWAWLKAHPGKAPEIMRANHSYIFFKRVGTEAALGPVGGAGVPLTAGRSLAVDRRARPYGTLVWLEGELPQPEGGTAPLRRLAVAQDTGTAIVGPARGDLFFGSGERAGAAASLVRHPVRWVVLREKPQAKRARR